MVESFLRMCFHRRPTRFNSNAIADLHAHYHRFDPVVVQTCSLVLGVAGSNDLHTIAIVVSLKSSSNRKQNGRHAAAEWA